MDSAVSERASAEPRARASTAPARPASTIEAVDRAFDLRETLSRSGGSLSLSALSAETGLNPSTCHHLLAALAARGYIGRNPRTREYRLGNKVFELSASRARQFDLIEVAMPWLRALNRDTGEAVHLAVVRARELVTLAQLDSLRAIKVDSGFAGKSSADHATASGKAILAWLAESELRAIVATKGMERFTANTIGGLETLKGALALVRRHGFADVQERWREQDL